MEPAFLRNFHLLESGAFSAFALELEEDVEEICCKKHRVRCHRAGHGSEESSWFCLDCIKLIELPIYIEFISMHEHLTTNAI